MIKRVHIVFALYALPFVVMYLPFAINYRFLYIFVLLIANIIFAYGFIKNRNESNAGVVLGAILALFFTYVAWFQNV